MSLTLQQDYFLKMFLITKIVLSSSIGSSSCVGECLCLDCLWGGDDTDTGECRRGVARGMVFCASISVVKMEEDGQDPFIEENEEDALTEERARQYLAKGEWRLDLYCICQLKAKFLKS